MTGTKKPPVLRGRPISTCRRTDDSTERLSTANEQFSKQAKLLVQAAPSAGIGISGNTSDDGHEQGAL